MMLRSYLSYIGSKDGKCLPSLTPAHGQLAVQVHDVPQGPQASQCVAPLLPACTPITDPPRTGMAKLCCEVVAACKCGKNFTGPDGQSAFKAHQKKCSAGAAPLVPIA